MHWSGRLQAGVSAKDMMLHMVGRFGMNGGQYQAVEFAGSAVQALSMAERMTLSNMSAEMGAQAGLIAADETTLQHLRGIGVAPEHLVGVEQWCTDEDADFEQHSFDANTLSPQVAAPQPPTTGPGRAKIAQKWQQSPGPQMR